MVESAVISPPASRSLRPSSEVSARDGVAAFAALDLGTNNCRLLVGRPAGRGFVVLDSFSRTVRLGEHLEEAGRLDPAAMDRALIALASCAARLARWHPAAIAAVATEACRRAANGEEFLARARRETGLAITIISPREEALLAIESCASLLQRSPRAVGAIPTRALLFDIGGGSTELAWLRLDAAGRPSLIGCASIPVGVVTLTERYGRAAITAGGYVAMTAETTALLAPFEAVHCIAREIRQGQNGSVLLLGTSGTLTTMAAIALALPRYRRSLVDGTHLSRAAALSALAQVAALDHAGLVSHPCIGPDRALFVLPGAAIFAAILRTWPAAEIIVADRGLREGLLLRVIRGHRRPRAGAHH
ncbi:MAG: Ppx/GppA phosphatase family protein [Acetobacteraceae bacterium]